VILTGGIRVSVVASPSPTIPLVEAVRHAPERLRAVAASDATLLASLPGGRWTAAVLAAALGLWFGGVHLDITPVGTWGAFGYGQPTQLVLVNIYTESIPFMVAAVAIGLLGRTPGMLLVAIFSVADFASWLLLPRLVNQGGGPPMPFTVLGHLITYGLLWFLVVTIPRLQRSTHLVLASRGRRAALLAPVGAAVATGVLVWLWTLPVTYAVRPFFNGGPQWQAVWQVQTAGWVIAVGAGVAALLVAVVVQRGHLYWVPDRIPVLGEAVWRTPGLGKLIKYAVVLALVAGFITTPLDLAIFVVALLVGDLVSPRIGARLRGSVPFPRLPTIVALAIAMLVSALLSAAILVPWYAPALGSEFLPLVVAIAAAMVVVPIVVEALADPGASSVPDVPRVPPGPGSVVTSLGLATVLLLAMPTAAAADNCSGLIDCVTTFGAWLAANIAAIGAFIWAWLKGVFSKVPRVLGGLEPLASEDAVPAIRGEIASWQDTVAKTVMRDTGNYDEFSRIKNLSPAEFIAEAQTGKWDGILGYGGGYGGGGDGGLSISGSASP
jgi:hypothetical protein